METQLRNEQQQHLPNDIQVHEDNMIPEPTTESTSSNSIPMNIAEDNGTRNDNNNEDDSNRNETVALLLSDDSSKVPLGVVINDGLIVSGTTKIIENQFELEGEIYHTKDASIALSDPFFDSMDTDTDIAGDIYSICTTDLLWCTPAMNENDSGDDTSLVVIMSMDPEEESITGNEITTVSENMYGFPGNYGMEDTVDSEQDTLAMVTADEDDDDDEIYDEEQEYGDADRDSAVRYSSLLLKTMELLDYRSKESQFVNHLKCMINPLLLPSLTEATNVTLTDDTEGIPVEMSYTDTLVHASNGMDIDNPSDYYGDMPYEDDYDDDDDNDDDGYGIRNWETFSNEPAEDLVYLFSSEEFGEDTMNEVSEEEMNDILDPFIIPTYYFNYLPMIMRSNSISMLGTLTNAFVPRLPLWVSFLHSVQQTVPFHWYEAHLGIRDSLRWLTTEQCIRYHFRSLLVFLMRNILLTVNDLSINPVIFRTTGPTVVMDPAPVAPTESGTDDTIMLDTTINEPLLITGLPLGTNIIAEELDEVIMDSNNNASVLLLPPASVTDPESFPVFPFGANLSSLSSVHQDLYAQTIVLNPIVQFHLQHYKIPIPVMARSLGIMNTNHFEEWLQISPVPTTNRTDSFVTALPFPCWYQINLRIHEFLIDLRNQRYRSINTGYSLLPWYTKNGNNRIDILTEGIHNAFRCSLDPFSTSSNEVGTLTVHDRTFIESISDRNDSNRVLLQAFKTDMRINCELFRSLYVRRVHTLGNGAWKRIRRYRSIVREWERLRELAYVKRMSKEYAIDIRTNVSTVISRSLYDWTVSKGYDALFPSLKREKFNDLATEIEQTIMIEELNVDDDSPVNGTTAEEENIVPFRKSKQNSTESSHIVDTVSSEKTIVPISHAAVSQPQHYAYRQLSTGYILYSDTYEGEQQEVCGAIAESIVHQLEENRCTICGLAQEYSAESLRQGTKQNHDSGFVTMDHTIIECALCHVRFHPRCYGISKPSLVTDHWHCDPCKRENRSDGSNESLRSSMGTHRTTSSSVIAQSVHDSIECVVCNRPSSGLVMKATVDNRWMHVICAITNPYITYAYGQRHRLLNPDATILLMIRSFLQTNSNLYTVSDKVIDKCILCHSGCMHSTGLVECCQLAKGCVHRAHASCALQAGWLRVTHYTFGGLYPLVPSSSVVPVVGEWSVSSPLPNLLHPLSQGPLFPSSTVFHPRFFLDIDLPPLSKRSIDTNGSTRLIQEFPSFNCDNPKLQPLIQELHDYGYSHGTQQFISFALKRIRQLSLGGTISCNPAPGQMIPVRGLSIANNDVFTEGIPIETNTSSSSLSSVSPWITEYQSLATDYRNVMQSIGSSGNGFSAYVPSDAFIETIYRRIGKLSNNELAHRLRASISTLPLHFYYRIQCSQHSRNGADPGRRFVGNGAGTVAGHIIPFWWYNNGYQSLNTVESVITAQEDLKIPLANHTDCVTPCIPRLATDSTASIRNKIDSLSYQDTQDIINQRKQWLSKYSKNGIPVPMMINVPVSSSESVTVSSTSCCSSRPRNETLDTTIDINDEMLSIENNVPTVSIGNPSVASIMGIANADESTTVRKKRRTYTRKGNDGTVAEERSNVSRTVPQQESEDNEAVSTLKDNSSSLSVTVSSSSHSSETNSFDSTINTFTSSAATPAPPTTTATTSSRPTRSSRRYSNSIYDDFIMLN